MRVGRDRGVLPDRRGTGRWLTVRCPRHRRCSPPCCAPRSPLLCGRSASRDRGRSSNCPDPASWALLGFQKSAYNTAGHVEFTVNVTAAGKTSWAQARERLPHLPARPNPNVVYGSAAWHSRIGSLLPTAQDTWWTIAPTTDPSRTARSVMATITSYALPVIREQLLS
ncbi:DUF4304 domain-containing protein [Streptomyces fuscichromogenes]|uniref:DUF4304 domain-containing protein n=1 Tax=Streptomyces fuscichromogenes TaxID=1324013 RepID=UPI00166FCC58